ncbi:VOC family protein [Paraburkholderia phenoliruptrix]|uniref:VOC family protein n=1 Tax=Paraburkholderia phenoliruptrix TaxID=252970 RepID=UPI00286980F8|nr:VOC family protein [Paraburkholderia phenoliruptrix]WMY07590.1 VOC family protein [Paraburkholderia phenoliruptrix]
MNIVHVALWTRDLDEAALFWRRYFDADVGAAYQSKRRPGFVSRFVRLRGDQTMIELMTGPWIANGSPMDRVGWDHLAICLGDSIAVDELAKRCDADGLLISAPRTTGDGFYEAVIATPDGTWIEITD